MKMKLMTSKPLTEQIPYRKVIWVFGFAKTISSTTLITLGIGLLIDGISNHLRWRGYNQVELRIGILALTIGVIIVILIDIWKNKKKREELEIIDKTIDEKANEIAERKILEAMEKLEQ